MERRRAAVASAHGDNWRAIAAPLGGALVCSACDQSA
jgi:hypothetical protein